MLYSFCSQIDCVDGADPFAGLLADAHGNLYGTTISGGTGAGKGGAVFKLSPPSYGRTVWSESVLYGFCAQNNCADGLVPLFCWLIADARGNLYGTTEDGGGKGGGNVFKVSP